MTFILLGLLCSLSLGRAASQVVAWGSNFYGQTNVPPGLANVVAISAGYAHSLVLKADGTTTNWGAFLYLDNHRGIIWAPQSLTNISAIAAGYSDDVALRSDGGEVAWGYSYYFGGQTNILTLILTNVAAICASYRPLSLLADDSLVYGGANPQPALSGNVVAVACGPNHNLALKADGTVAAWGNNARGQTTVPQDVTNAVAVALGYNHSLALRADGTVVVWGDNSSGQRNVPAGLANVVAITANGYRSLALRKDGTIVSWGAGSAGEGAVPSGLANVAAISAGLSHNLALVGEVPPMLNRLRINLTVPYGTPVSLPASATGSQPLHYQWRFNGEVIPGETNSFLRLETVQFTNSGAYSVIVSNAFGSVTSEDSMLYVEPLLITQQPQGQYIHRGGTVSFAVTAHGVGLSYQWQLNGIDVPGATNSNLTITNTQFSQSGKYAAIITNAFASLKSEYALLSVGQVAFLAVDHVDPRTLPLDLTNLIAVAGGMALRADGSITAWGQPNIPTDLTNVVAISSGMALKADGTVVVWDPTNSPPDLTNVVAIASPYRHRLALKADGIVVAWGDDFHGETEVPSNLTNVVQIAGGYSHSLAVKADGTVVAWGRVGLPAFALANVVSVAGGNDASIALRADGTVVAWGYDLRGASTVPVGLNNVVAIAGGCLHGLALQAEGTIVAWGSYCATLDNFFVRPDLKTVVAFANDLSDVALIGDEPPQLHVLLTNPAWTTNGFSISLPTQSGRVYRLEYKNSLEDTAWTALPLVAGNGRMKVLTDPTVINSQRYYRVSRW